MLSGSEAGERRVEEKRGEEGRGGKRREEERRGEEGRVEGELRGIDCNPLKRRGE